MHAFFSAEENLAINDFMLSIKVCRVPLERVRVGALGPNVGEEFQCW